MEDAMRDERADASATGADELIPVFDGAALRPHGKLAAHREGLRHPAVSVFVMRGGRTLLQRRAAGKYHSPGLWANACCTHPLWTDGGVEPMQDCAARRLGEELGLVGLALRPAGRVEYRADVGGGLTEHEVVDLFLAEAPEGTEPVPDPREVAETRWIAPGDLRAEIDAAPERFAPWLRIYVREHEGLIFD